MALEKHYDWKGKIEIISRARVENSSDPTTAYTPGVAEPCLVIKDDVDKSYELTRRWNLVAVVTDGSAVLGLGNIGPEAGSAGTAIANHLLRLGVKNLILCDKFGIICEGMEGLSPSHAEMSKKTNPEKLQGSLSDALCGADVFIGVSAPNIVSAENIKSMAEKPIVFPMANPVPEIPAEVALSAGAAVVGTGRSNLPNQINNVLAFPGIFRGALDVRARDVNEEMKMAASYAIAGLVSDDDLGPEYIIPKAFDPRVGKAVAEAVAKAAKDSGVARI